MKKLQCKNLDKYEILLFLYIHKGELCNNCFGDERDIRKHLFHKIPLNLFYAKMYQLIHKGYVDGCWCGCRGDYEITEKGIKYLEHHQWPNGEPENHCGSYLDFIGHEIPYELPKTIIIT